MVYIIDMYSTNLCYLYTHLTRRGLVTGPFNSAALDTFALDIGGPFNIFGPCNIVARDIVVPSNDIQHLIHGHWLGYNIKKLIRKERVVVLLHGWDRVVVVLLHGGTGLLLSAIYRIKNN